MPYQHTWIDGQAISLPVGKVVCVGRNYLNHIRELNNAVPEQPLLFMKPSTALSSLETAIRWPENSGVCHHELELAVLIGERLSKVTAAEVSPAIVGYGLALDLTLRDVQQQIKAQGHPWELAKAFDGACPMSPFIAADQIADPQRLALKLWINQQLRQQGNSCDMIYDIVSLISHISRHFTLLPGDIILTGTPAGVGPLNPQDELVLEMDAYRFKTRVA